MSRQSIFKTVIVGTERSPLAENDLVPLGLSPSPDSAQTALEALAATNLLRKAGFPLPKFPISNFQFPISPPDERPVCSGAAVKDLNLMLNGHYADALPEFLGLLAQKNLRLPPEFLPDLLEKAAHDTAFAEKIRPALGPHGQWLAQHNPRWDEILAETETDWFTAPFAARLRLLKQTRARNPLLALAWLEKTWPEEKVSHQAQFLDALHIRLSPIDEDLLEKAFSEKNRDLRWAAAQALALLPESRVLAEAKTFFKERLSKGARPENRESCLKNALPDLSEEALQCWVMLLPPAAKGDWRNELFFLFVGLLPPSELPALLGISREETLESLNDAKGAAALAEAVVRHSDASWAEALLRHFSRDFRHAVWQSRAMTTFLTLFATETMEFLQKNNITLGYENERILRALENFRSPWPKSLFDNLLEQYRRSAFGGGGGIPSWHFALALQMAAYHCRPAEAADNQVVRDYLQNSLPSRPREFEEFLGILRFRQKMKEHLDSQFRVV